YNLGYLAAKTLHPDQALAAYKESARVLESLKARSPGVPVYRMKLAVSKAAIAEVLADTTPEEAAGALKKALEEQSAVLAEYPGVLESQQLVGRHHYLLAKQLLKSNPADAFTQAESA